jgi:hypothetical protein
MTESQSTNAASNPEGAPSTRATQTTQTAAAATQTAAQAASAPSANYPAKKSTSGIAIAGLVVAIVAIVLSWMPFINNVAAVIAIVALALGIAGVVATGKNKTKSGRGIAIAGVIVAIVSFAVVLYTQSVYVDALNSAFDGPSGTVSTAETTAATTDSTATGTDTSSSTEASSMTDLAIGTPVTYSDGMTVVVNSVTTGLVNYDGSPAIAVNVTYTYNGSSSSSYAGAFNEFDWTGQTAAGVQSSYYYYSNAQDELSSGNLVPGGTVTGNVYFSGDTVKVIYAPSWFSNTNQASWIVG